MTVLQSNPIPQINKEEISQTGVPANVARYRQPHRLADMSVGRIRRWGQPFRRAFLMKKQRILTAFFVALNLSFPKVGFPQTTNVVILDSTEIANLRRVVSQNERAKYLYDSIASLARAHSEEAPRPLKRLHYEGLLETNPDRIDTRKSLRDMDKVISFIYASYGSNDTIFAHKTKQFVLAWANAYQPDGNPINENKFVALYWGYYLFQDHFSDREQEKAEDWMVAIARQEIGPKTYA